MSTHPKIRTHCHREITLHITHRAERKAPVVISIVIESSSFLVKGKVNSETWWVAFLHFFSHTKTTTDFFLLSSQVFVVVRKCLHTVGNF